MSASFKVSANHVSPAYRLEGKVFHVAKNVDDCGMVGYHRAQPEHGIPEEFYAKLSGFGCGKSFSNAVAAIRSLLADNGCTDIRIEKIETPAAETPAAEALELLETSFNTAHLPHIVVYRKHGDLHLETKFYGPFANHDDAYDFCCTLPAIGHYDDDLHAGQYGCKYTQVLIPTAN